MALTIKTRKLVHRKAWEMCTPAPANTAAGSFVVSDKFNIIPNSLAFFVAGYSNIYRYDGDEDSWVQIPNSGLAGTFGAGACGEFRGLGAMGGVFTQTATGGAAGVINTNRTIVRNLVDRKIRVIGGAGLGFVGKIKSNTIGANAIITVKNANGTDATQVFDATTQYQIFSGSLWVQGAGASAGFGVYDLATNAWTLRTATALTWGVDGQLVSALGSANGFATGTATSATSTTLVHSTKSWLSNQWANHQVRITKGTGAGQIREISSNTGTTLTVAAAWAVTPDSTSEYIIEGNEDNFYLGGNNAVTLYRFKVSTNAWTTLTPTAARAGAMGAGATLCWADSVTNWDVDATTGQPANHTQGGTQMYRQNGRYLLSFRGGGTNSLDVYDIAANTWISGLSYGYMNETFTTGTASVDFDGMIYLQKEATGRIFRFNLDRWTLQSFAYNPQPQGAVLVGGKMFMLPYQEDGSELLFFYTLVHTSNILMRMLVI